jgi:alkylation response protein AidB-like acyl-CoA dehydrogenase
MSLPYQPALDAMRFSLAVCGRLQIVRSLPPCADFSDEIIATILEEAARFATDVLSPLNPLGDRKGARLENGSVSLPAGFAEAYRAFCANGWNGAPVPAALGGQGLPAVVSTLVNEMWHGANMAFGLAPMLTQSAIELLAHHGSAELREYYLPKLVEGTWAGTMCMTEPQAGSDVGAVRTRATSDGEAYRLKGTKIFITYGEQDLTENIIHMVLARLPDAPEGTKGLSLFLVPKFLPGGARNDVQCVSLEHKMGIRASPTCVMSFGEREGATGWLIGEPNKGMSIMFSMMNAARFAVGLEAVGVAGYAAQLAQAYAAGRVQGKTTIDQHPDVARMLAGIRSRSAALCGLALYAASYMDEARHSADAAARAAAQERLDLLIPVVKAHASNVAFALCSQAMQVAGGMGYVEEAGFSQLLRDVRITMIYEGTNGIQALDLVQRKLPVRDYAVVRAYLGEIWQHAVRLGRHADPALAFIGRALEEGHRALDEATVFLQQLRSDSADDPQAAQRMQAAASAYLSLFGLVSEGYVLALGAASTPEDDAKPLLACAIEQSGFFARQILPHAHALKQRIFNG